MPVYEYICEECSRTLEVDATMSEKEKGLYVVCPFCGSSKMNRRYTPLMVKNSGVKEAKASSCPMADGCAQCPKMDH